MNYARAGAGIPRSTIYHYFAQYLVIITYAMFVVENCILDLNKKLCAAHAEHSHKWRFTGNMHIVHDANT